MVFIGPISSIFDFLTFYVLLHFFHAGQVLFHTGWFVESLATQTLVLFVIRTAQNPLRSRPSRPLMATVLIIVAAGMLLPFSPLAGPLGFAPLAGKLLCLSGGSDVCVSGARGVRQASPPQSQAGGEQLSDEMPRNRSARVAHYRANVAHLSLMDGGSL